MSNHPRPPSRKTDGKRLRKKLAALNARLRALRTEGGNALVAFLVRHLQGHIQYYGVSGNSRGVSSYVYCSARPETILIILNNMLP